MVVRFGPNWVGYEMQPQLKYRRGTAIDPAPPPASDIVAGP
jgi:hypothetical protein